MEQKIHFTRNTKMQNGTVERVAQKQCPNKALKILSGSFLNQKLTDLHRFELTVQLRMIRTK